MNTPTTETVRQSTITPFAGNILRAFAICSSLFLLFRFLAADGLNPLWGLLLGLAGIFSVFYFTTRFQSYFTPIIFALFFYLGCALDLASILGNKGARLGSGSIGLFDYSDEQIVPIVLVILTGLAALVAANFIGHRFIKNCFGKTRTFAMSNVRTHSVLWLLFSVLVILLMWALGIGRTGLQHSTILPLKLTGALVFFRNIVIPFGCILLFDLALQHRRKLLTSWVLIAMVITGVLGAVAGTSRGFFIYAVFPPIFFLLLCSAKGSWTRKILFQYLGLAFVMVLLVLMGVQNLRVEAFFKNGTSIESGYSSIVNTLGSFDVSAAFTLFFELAFQRIGGVRELISATLANINDPYATWAVFVGEDRAYLDKVIMSMYGSLPTVDSKRAFGIAFGFWGMFALSGSLLVVFLGSFFSYLMIMLVEELFLSRNLRAVACFFAFYLAMGFWGNVYVFFLTRTVFVVLLCFAFIYAMEKYRERLGKKKPQVHGSPRAGFHVDGRVSVNGIS